MSEKWEVVVKGGKSVPEGKVSAKEVRQAREILLGTNKYIVGRQEGSVDEGCKPGKTGKSKQKNVGQGDGNFLGLNIAKLNNDQIKTLHKDLQEKFPNQPSLVLMNLAAHLNILLKMNEEAMKNITFDNIDFQYELLSHDTKIVLRNVFSGLSNIQLGGFIKSAMTQIIEDSDRGIKPVGLLLLVQVCLRLKPVAIISNRKPIFDLLNMHRDHPAKFKCLIWVLKQACTNMHVASQIWLINLLPFIGQRFHTENVISFGEAMLNYPADVSESAVLHTDFFPLIELVFHENEDSEISSKKLKKKVSSFQLNHNHLQRLSFIYQKIKEQVFTSKTSLKEYITFLFTKLSVKEKNGQLNKEILDCIDRCVKFSPESVKQLDHLYNGYPLQTKIFLANFSSSKSAAASIIMKHRSTKNNTTKAHTSTKTAPQKKPIQRSVSSGSCLGTLLKIVLYLAITGLIVTLVVKYQYPQQYKLMVSRTGPILESLVEKGGPYLSMCQEKISQVYLVSEPYLKSAMDKAHTMSMQAWTVSKPYVYQVMTKVQETGMYLYEKMDEVAPQVLEKVGVVFVSVEKYVVEGYSDLVTYINSPQFQEVVDSVSKRSQFMADQVVLAYRSTLMYVMKVVGY